MLSKCELTERLSEEALTKLAGHMHLALVSEKIAVVRQGDMLCENMYIVESGLFHVTRVYSRYTQ